MSTDNVIKNLLDYVIISEHVEFFTINYLNIILYL